MAKKAAKSAGERQMPYEPRAGIEGDGLAHDELVSHAEGIYGVDKPDPIPEPAVEPDPNLDVPAREPKPEPVAATPAEDEPAAGGAEPEPVPDPEAAPTDEPPEPVPAPEAEHEPEPIAATPEVPPPAEPAPEPKPTAEEAMVHQMQKLRAKNEELERQAALSQTAQPPYQPAPAQPTAPAPVPGAPPPPQITYAEDGTPQMPDPNDPATRAYFQSLVAPTPIERHQMEQAERQRDFDTRKAAFIAEDERRAPIADRVEQASRMLNLRALEVMKRTGERPQGPEQEAAFLERHGIGDEFRQYVPEVSAEGMADFIDAMFTGSVRTQERYMRDFCGRILEPQAPAVPPKPPAQAKPLPADIPPRLAGQGTPSLEREGKPGKEERLRQLSAKKGAEPDRFTVEENTEWSRLVKEMGFQV